MRTEPEPLKCNTRLSKVENSIIKITTTNKHYTEGWNEDIVFPLHQTWHVFYHFIHSTNGTKAWIQLSEQHSGVKESAFPKDSSLHLDAVGAPLSSLDSHLFTLAPGWAMFPWRYKIKDDHVARFRPEATIQNQYSLKGVTFQSGQIWPALC